jgi:hypothetical protein
MGLEDYRVLLRPRRRKSVFPGEGAAASGGAPGSAAGPTGEQIAEALEALGFERLPAALQVGPARLAAADESELRLTARKELPSAGGDPRAAGEYVVEALIRCRTQPASRPPLLESLSMRFAVCQPEGAAWHFLKLVKGMCDSLSLEVVHGEKTYSPEAFWAFRLHANEQIRIQLSLWREIFEGDPECPPIAVEETWGHFLKKHPSLSSDGEGTMMPREAARAAEEVDMEATLPPKAARELPIPRKSRT